MRLGISTHSEEELAIALAAEPDYVALGPIYETRLKVMKWAPQGLDRIADWKRRIGDLPLVAIGGITPERADGVAGGRRRQPGRDHRFLHPPRSGGRVREWLAWAERSGPDFSHRRYPVTHKSGPPADCDRCPD